MIADPLSIDLADGPVSRESGDLNHALGQIIGSVIFDHHQGWQQTGIVHMHALFECRQRRHSRTIRDGSPRRVPPTRMEQTVAAAEISRVPGARQPPQSHSGRGAPVDLCQNLLDDSYAGFSLSQLEWWLPVQLPQRFAEPSIGLR